jgi:hypothetical protein
LTGCSNQVLSVLLGVDEGDATASLRAEDVRRRNFVPIILDLNVASETAYCAESVMALPSRWRLARPLNDGGGPYMSLTALGGKSGKAAEKILRNFELKSSCSSSPKVGIDRLHQHAGTSGQG